MASLPPSPHLEHLKNQAKDLLKGHRSSDPAVLPRLRQTLPELAERSDEQIFQSPFGLKNAQHVVAREYGFDRWDDLRRHVEALQESAAAETGGHSAELESICRAVEAGDAETVAAMLEANPALATARLERDGQSEMARLTLLHRADVRAGSRRRKMTAGHLQAAQLLIDYGADVDAIVDGYATPLEVAAWSGNGELVDLLLANGTNPNLGTDGTPVESAVSHDHRAVFKRLVAGGADYHVGHTIRLGMLRETRGLLDADPSLASAPTPTGDLPLNIAAGKQGIFNLLLRRGADIHARDAQGMSALLAARAAGNDKAVAELLQRGVEDDIFGAIADRDAAKVAAILQSDPAQGHPVGGGSAPIMWAVHSGSEEIVELLLDQRVEVDIWNGFGGRDYNNYSSPLIQAIKYRYDGIARLLLDYGADPDPEDCRDWPGFSWPELHFPPGPLHYGSRANPLGNAVRWGTIRAIEMLLDAGADPDRAEALGWAALGGDLGRAKLLLDRGADLRSPSTTKALRTAAHTGKTLIVELFGTRGIDLENVGTESGRKNKTALDMALQRDHADTAELLRELIEIGRGEEGARLLQARGRFIEAIIDGDADAVRSLAREQPALAEHKIVREDLFHYAARAGQQAVVDALVEAGAPWTIAAAATLGRVEQVEALLGETPSLLDDPSVLIGAVARDQVEVVEWLLDRGADPDGRVPGRGWTALHEAVQQSSVQSLELLLYRGAEVGAKDQWGRVALKVNWPLTLEREKIRDLLVAHGAKPADQQTLPSVW